MLEFLTYLLPDGGPWYAETAPGNFPVEPWNAWSSLTFLIPAFYWMQRGIRASVPNYFLVFCCALLAIGGTGSALYHAFRSSTALLIMDVLPVGMLILSVSLFFWYRMLKNGWLVALITLSVGAIRGILFFYVGLRTQTAINISYFISGIFMLFPMVVMLYKTRGEHWISFAGTLCFLSLALTFRSFDVEATAYMSMGSHWLWHTCTSVAAFFLGYYIFYFPAPKNIE